MMEPVTSAMGANATLAAIWGTIATRSYERLFQPVWLYAKTSSRSAPRRESLGLLSKTLCFLRQSLLKGGGVLDPSSSHRALGWRPFRQACNSGN